MGRRIDIDDLVDAALIAERLGLAHVQSAHNLWRRHEDFPTPIGQWGHFRLWSWSEVEDWARATGRLAG